MGFCGESAQPSSSLETAVQKARSETNQELAAERIILILARVSFQDATAEKQRGEFHHSVLTAVIFTAEQEGLVVTWVTDALTPEPSIPLIFSPTRRSVGSS